MLICWVIKFLCFAAGLNFPGSPLARASFRFFSHKRVVYIKQCHGMELFALLTGLSL